MILYPTETVYGLGVNPFDERAVAQLYQLKQRPQSKPVSWLVRGIKDIERYARLSPRARAIVDEHLPGPLTLVLPSRDGEQLLSFRVSSDPHTQQFIERFMNEFDAPLTCSSANLSGQPTLPTPERIVGQFGQRAQLIDEIIDDGPRHGQPSTVVKVVGDKVEIIRQGSTKLASNI